MSEAVRQALVDYIRLSHSDIFRDLLTCRSNPLPLSLEYEAIDRLERLGAMKPFPDDANLCLTEQWLHFDEVDESKLTAIKSRSGNEFKVHQDANDSAIQQLLDRIEEFERRFKEPFTMLTVRDHHYDGRLPETES